MAPIQTADYFSSIVEDPYTCGRIAAANSLSDVYAMGGTPQSARSIGGFPALGVDFSTSGEVMSGGVSMLNEAGGPPSLRRRGHKARAYWYGSLK